VTRRRPALIRGRHFEDVIIILCVRWYLRYLQDSAHEYIDARCRRSGQRKNQLTGVVGRTSRVCAVPSPAAPSLYADDTVLKSTAVLVLEGHTDGVDEASSPAA
jgi:hypothetical protein